MARAVPVLLGLWLAASALVLSPAGAARTADLAAGAALVAIALLARPGSPAGFAVVVLASWLVAAPAALRFPDAAAAVNDVGVGLVALVVALHHAAIGRAERRLILRARDWAARRRGHAATRRAPAAAARA